MYVQFVHSALGNEGGGVQLVYEGTCCLAWGDIFDTRKDRGVVCVFSILNALLLYIDVMQLEPQKCAFFLSFFHFFLEAIS